MIKNSLLTLFCTFISCTQLAADHWSRDTMLNRYQKDWIPATNGQKAAHMKGNTNRKSWPSENGGACLQSCKDLTPRKKTSLGWTGKMQWTDPMYSGTGFADFAGGAKKQSLICKYEGGTCTMYKDSKNKDENKTRVKANGTTWRKYYWHRY